MNIYERESRNAQGHMLGHHHVMMKERKLMDVTGVKKLLSFDSELFIIDTTMGILSVRGADLELKNLDLDKGELAITGHVMAYEYDDIELDYNGKGIFKKLFK